MMKKLNLGMCLLALLSICALPATAQRKDTDAAVKALTKVIKKWSNTPKTLDNAVENICSKYKKEPSVYNGAAEAFWWNGADSAHAIKYANKAIAIDSKYAPAYVLQGDIWRHYKDTVMAKKWYEKAITANPQSTVGYEAYAKMIEESDPDGAVAMLEKITAAHPEYPFHLKAARIYDRQTENHRGEYLYTKAISHYEQVEPDSMECGDVISYTRIYWGLKDYNKCLAILEPYMSKYTSDSYFNNLCLQTSVEAGQYSKAEQFANNFLSSAHDSIRKTQYYKYCIRTYMGLKKYEEAIEVSKTLMGLDIATDEDKQYAIGKIADAYSELGEFDNAVDAYTEYIGSREKTNKLTAWDLNAFAELYKNKAKISNGNEKTVALMKADSIYNTMANKFLQNSDYALYQRYDITTQIHGYKDGAALDICNKLVSTLLAKGELNNTNKARLVAAYQYIAADYVYRLSNFKKAKEYYQKIVAINPNDKNALDNLEVLKKY